MASSPKPGDVAQPTCLAWFMHLCIAKRIKTTPLATTSKRVSDLEHDIGEGESKGWNIAELKMKLEESNGEMQKQQLVVCILVGVESRFGISRESETFIIKNSYLLTNF